MRRNKTWRFVRRWFNRRYPRYELTFEVEMPVDRNRHGGHERLPDDKPGSPWLCVNAACGVENTTPIEQGCPVCGAGAPGYMSNKRQPTLEEIEAQRGLPLTPARKPASTMPTSSLADRLGGPDFTLDDIRQVIREELATSGQGTGLQLSIKERHLVLEGIAVIQAVAAKGRLGPEEIEKFPDVEGMEALWQRIAQEGE